MPEVYMKIEWPDKKADRIYSPSSVIQEYFTSGEVLSLGQFEQKAVEALTKASGRVLAKYGYECTSAMSEIERIRSIVSIMGDKTKEMKITSL